MHFWTNFQSRWQPGGMMLILMNAWKGHARPCWIPIKTWMRDEKARPVYWLNGLAGTGKSTLAKSIAHFAAESGQLGATFFFAHAAKWIEAMSNSSFLPSHYIFLNVSRTSAPSLSRRYQDRRDIGHSLPSRQVQKLIIEPLQNTDTDPHTHNPL